MLWSLLIVIALPLLVNAPVLTNFVKGDFALLYGQFSTHLVRGATAGYPQIDPTLGFNAEPVAAHQWLPYVSSAPFGFPVVPDVYINRAGAAGSGASCTRDSVDAASSRRSKPPASGSPRIRRRRTAGQG